jgi:hypothetical protein
LPGFRLCWAINAVEAIADEPLTAKEGWRRFVDRQPHPPVLLGAAWLANCLSVTWRPTTMAAAGITPTCRW